MCCFTRTRKSYPRPCSNLDLPAGMVMAPKTQYHCSRRQIYLISIPKAGTHLLRELLEIVGFRFAMGASD